jgi:hypothetical protein
MSQIRGRGNKDTELALARLLRRNKISGWRRQQEVRSQNFQSQAGFHFSQIQARRFCGWLLLA